MTLGLAQAPDCANSKRFWVSLHIGFAGGGRDQSSSRKARTNLAVQNETARSAELALSYFGSYSRLHRMSRSTCDKRPTLCLVQRCPRPHTNLETQSPLLVVI